MSYEVCEYDYQQTGFITNMTMISDSARKKKFDELKLIAEAEKLKYLRPWAVIKISPSDVFFPGDLVTDGYIDFGVIIKVTKINFTVVWSSTHMICY